MPDDKLDISKESVTDALEIIEYAGKYVQRILGEDIVSDAGVKKIDSVTQGYLSGRYDAAGLGVFETSTLENLLSGGRLTPRSLREIAKQCSIIRYCIDTLVREVPSTIWNVKVREGYRYPRNKLRAIEKFIKMPILGYDDYTFELFMRQSLRDLFVLDWTLIEKVRSSSGKLVELYPLDAGKFSIRMTDDGRVKYYVRGMVADDGAALDKEQIFYPSDVVSKCMYPRTSTPYGCPIIESLIEEIGAIVFSTIHIRKSFTEGTIPPGVLNVGPMPKAIRDKMEAELKNRRGTPWELRILYGVAACEWIQFKRSHKDEEMSELRQHIERIIYRNFGFNQIDVADTGSLSKANAREQKNVGRTRLFLPILELYKNMFDYIIHYDLNAPELEFVWTSARVEDLESMTRAFERAINNGLMSINKAGRMLGEDPVDGGDERFVRVGNQIILVKDIPKIKLQEMNGNGNGNRPSGEDEDIPEEQAEEQE